MVRGPCCEKKGMKKGAWTPEEDELLISYIHKNGHANWRALPTQAGLLRCGKSCRLRWSNYLRPDIKRGNFTHQEEETIIKLHQMLGNRWSAIAARLPGRTDNEIKNVWHTNIKKKIENDEPHTTKRKIFSVPKNNFKENKSIKKTIVPGNGKIGLKGNPVSPEQSSSCELSSVTDASAKIDKSFLSEHSSSEVLLHGKESGYVNPLANYDLFVKQEEIDSSMFIRQKERGFEEQVSPPYESIIECDLQGLKEEPVFEFPCSSVMECDNVCSGKAEDDMDFWFNLFIRTEDLPDLPEF